MRGLKVTIKPDWIILLAFALFFVVALWAQEVNLKQKAIDEFKNKHYPEAISLMRRAVSENPGDAEIWYYLGYFTHYLCADWIPLTECDEKKSDEILEYLDKAITLDPMYGNAYYFIGAEHGGRFLRAMQEGDVRKMRMELLNGRNKGGYPDWLIEYARNMLRTCQPNTILFTGGDADSWPTWYLQFCENYRTDVTVIPIGLLNRPWFVLTLKNGIENILVSAPISWREEQIFDMHPYKWKTYTIEIPIPEEALERYNILPQDSLMKWKLEPNLQTSSREFLGTERVVLADIIKTNRWKRPVVFSLGCSKTRLANLDKFMQLCGLFQRLLPVEAEKYDLSLNPNEIEAALLQSEHYRYFADVKEHNMPRISHLLNCYRGVLLTLANYYIESRNQNKAREIVDKMKIYMPESVFPSSIPLKNAIESLDYELSVE